MNTFCLQLSSCTLSLYWPLYACAMKGHCLKRHPLCIFPVKATHTHGVVPTRSVLRRLRHLCLCTTASRQHRHISHLVAHPPVARSQARRPKRRAFQGREWEPHRVNDRGDSNRITVLALGFRVLSGINKIERSFNLKRQSYAETTQGNAIQDT